MITPAALMVLAVFQGDTINPTDSLNLPHTIQSQERAQKRNARDASPQQQTNGDGTVHDKSTAPKQEYTPFPHEQLDNEGVVTLPYQSGGE